MSFSELKQLKEKPSLLGVQALGMVRVIDWTLLDTVIAEVCHFTRRSPTRRLGTSASTCVLPKSLMRL